MSLAEDLIGKEIGDWIVLARDADKCKNVICRCKCGIEKSVKASNLIRTTCCRACYYKKIDSDITGRKFGKWLVLRRDESRNKATCWICTCECGFEKSLSRARLKNCDDGCLKCRKSNVDRDLKGKKFGGWSVLCLDDKNTEKWVCKCDCGIVKSVFGYHLCGGRSVSCRKCSEHKHKGRLNGHLWSRLLYMARQRGIKVDLGEITDAKKFLYDLLYVDQKCKCALTGRDISIANVSSGHDHGETTASLDRIDSSKSYTRDNVHWVHKYVNAMKWDFELDEFIDWCEAVVNYAGKQKDGF